MAPLCQLAARCFCHELKQVHAKQVNATSFLYSFLSFYVYTYFLCFFFLLIWASIIPVTFFFASLFSFLSFFLSPFPSLFFLFHFFLFFLSPFFEFGHLDFGTQ